MKVYVHKMLIYVLILMLILISAVSCQNTTISEPDTDVKVVEEKPAAGGAITIGSGEPKTLNPLTSDRESFIDISYLMFQRLVDYDSQLKIQPVLAKSWEYVDGTSDCIISLRSNIFWSDGVPVTARDVVFSLDTIKNSEISLYKNNLQHIYSYKAQDEKTIVVTFDQLFANSIEMLSIPIIPEHILAASPDSIPVTTGPYKIANYKKLEYMELEPNEYYVDIDAVNQGKDTIKPYIQDLKVMFISDTNAFSTAFQTKELDVLNTLTYDWEKYSEMKDVKTYKYITMNYDFIGMNFNNPIFKDIAVRNAMVRAIDRKALVNKYLLGNAVIVDAPVNPSSWLYDKEEVQIQYNIVEAKKLLEDAGFTDSNNDKILERTVDGVEQQLKFTLLTNTENDFRKKAAEDIKKNLEQLGFSVELKYVSFADILTAMETKQFDAVLTGYKLAYTQDLSFAFHGSQIESGKNYYSYSDNYADILLKQAYTTTNEATRLETYKKLQNYFMLQQPIISICFREGAIVARSKIKGDIAPDAVNQYRNFNNWFISQSNQ